MLRQLSTTLRKLGCVKSAPRIVKSTVFDALLDSNPPLFEGGCFFFFFFFFLFLLAIANNACAFGKYGAKLQRLFFFFFPILIQRYL